VKRLGLRKMKWEEILLQSKVILIHFIFLPKSKAKWWGKK